MWKVFESKKTRKALQKLPIEILKKYEIWKQIVHLSGPRGLREMKGFHDEKLSGIWKKHRSSRLSKQYRVIYEVKADVIRVDVFDITAHDYRRK